MARNIKVDHVSGKVIIVNKNAITAEESLLVADLRGKGYKVEEKKRKKNAKATKSESYYKGKMSAAQAKEFDKVKKANGYFVAVRWFKENVGE